MHELALVTVFLAGLLGSAHCVGMCGGIAAALGSTDSAPRRTWQPLLYQVGRIAGYGGIGAIAGAVGSAPGYALAGWHWSEVLRLATAAVVVLIGMNLALGSTVRPGWLRAPESWGAWLWRRIASHARQVLPRAPAARALTLGLLWGWMPCGLVYSVLIAAIVAGNAWSGGATMIAFGLGTVPAMAGLSFMGSRLPRPNGALAHLLGAALVACGLWTAVAPISTLSGAHHHAMDHMDHTAVDLGLLCRPTGSR